MKQQTRDTPKPQDNLGVAKSKKEILRDIALQSHKVIEDGRQRRMSTLDLIVLKLRNKALKDNNLRATNEFHRLSNKYDFEIENENCGYLLAPADLTYDEFIAKLKAEPETPRPGTDAHKKYMAERDADHEKRKDKHAARLAAIKAKYA